MAIGTPHSPIGTSPIVTREHGAWALVLTPLITGVCSAGPVWNHAALVVAAMAWFLCAVPAQMLLRSARSRRMDSVKLQAAWTWTIVYGSIAALASLVLLIEGYRMLAALGAGAVVLFAVNFVLALGRPKTVIGDVAALLALSFSAPAAFIVAGRPLDAVAFYVWGANVLFFTASVFHVHMKLRAASTKSATLPIGDRLSFGAANLTCHAACWGVLLVALFNNALPFAAILPFIPISCQALLGTVRLTGRTSFKRLGILLVAQAVVFGTSVVIAATTING